MTVPARVLVAVDDSPASLEAIRVAINLAAGWGATVRAVTVIEDHTVAAALAAANIVPGEQEALPPILVHATMLGRAHRVEVETMVDAGEPFERVLDQARAWGADLIVMGRSDRRGPRSPYLGSEAARVLEFSEWPVLVVPQRPARHADR